MYAGKWSLPGASLQWPYGAGWQRQWWHMQNRLYYHCFYCQWLQRLLTPPASTCLHLGSDLSCGCWIKTDAAKIGESAQVSAIPRQDSGRNPNPPTCWVCPWRRGHNHIHCCLGVRVNDLGGMLAQCFRHRRYSTYLNEQMCGWIDGCRDECVDGQVDGWMVGWRMHAWVCGRIAAWRERWWMNG